jgi:outer membrane protein OmpA-like peptidoglycan-associated protein
MMTTTLFFNPAKRSRLLITLALGAALSACATSPIPSSSDAAASPPPVPVLPFDEAVLKAANDLFSKAQTPPTDAASSAKYTLVIDPLIDGMTGNQSTATLSMQSRIEQLARDKYPQFDVQPFAAATVEKSPIVLVGTFTPVNQEGKTEGTRASYRICLALADLQSGKIVSKGVARAQLQGVDAKPTQYFRDSPAWSKDPATEGYIKTCQGTKPGDPINPVYTSRIKTAALISGAIEDYNAGRYQQALDQYQAVLAMPGGEQLRTYNGIYLANAKLGRRDAATQSFGQLVNYGLANKRLAIKFLFKPGSTAFLSNPQATGSYPLWLKQIATHTAKSNTCLEITGHTSPSGPEPINERLSLRRAEYIQQRLASQASALGKRTVATGKGSREALVGTGKDDITDALDRRVSFEVIDCATSSVATGS